MNDFKLWFKYVNKAKIFFLLILFIGIISITFIFLNSDKETSEEKNETEIKNNDYENISFENPTDEEIMDNYVTIFSKKNSNKGKESNDISEDNEVVEENENITISDEEVGEQIIKSEEISITVPNNQNKIKIVEGTEEEITNEVTIVDPKPKPTPLPKEKSNSNIEKVKDFYGKDYELINIGNNGFDVKRGNDFIHTYEDKLFGIWKWDKESINLASKTLHELGVPLEVKKIESNLNKMIDDWEERIVENNVEFRFGVQNIWVEW